MAMLPRLKPRCYYDLVIEVAIIRPGPIQGDMVHPYLRRRNGEEAVDYPSDDVQGRVAAHPGCADFPGTGHAACRRRGGIYAGRGGPAAARDGCLEATWWPWSVRGQADFSGMRERGYDEEFRAADISSQILRVSASTGFPESHSASFALLVYVSCWA